MADELYHQAILALAKRARAVGRLAAPTRSVTVDNPLCGDRVTLDLELSDGRVAAIGHQVRGCLLCQAAAAVIAERAPGQTQAALRDQAARWRAVVTSGAGAAAGGWPELDSFTPVQRHKSRHDCVLLPFDALVQALDGDP
jgi:nitrogen fixation NifU-like protein